MDDHALLSIAIVGFVLSSVGNGSYPLSTLLTDWFHHYFLDSWPVPFGALLEL
jgi:hypothetical protein